MSRSRAALLPHLVGYGLLLAIVTAIAPLDGSFGADDGAYGAQVHALRAGDWALERPLPVVPEGNEGWLNTAITARGPTPYTANPAYPVLLRSVADLVPGAWTGLGLQLVPLAGALASAAVAWALARAVDDRAGSGPLAYWLVALGPVVVNATTLWAHTVSTALGGLAVLALLRLARSPSSAGRAGWWLTLALSLSGAVAVRTEAVFWVVAVVAASCWIGPRARSVPAAGGAAAAAAGVWLASRLWGQSLRADRLPIETSVEALTSSGSWLATRVPAGWRLLLTGSGPGAALVLMALVAAVLGTAALVEGGDERRRLGPPLLVLAIALYGLRYAVAPDQPISGTLAAWPALAVLLVAGRRHLAGPRLRPLTVAAAVLVVAVLATQYSASGGHQWGGRYLSMAFVPMAVAAAVAGRRLVVDHRRIVAALVVVPALVGVAVSGNLHRTHRSVVAAATAEPSEVVITGVAALPRIGWTALPTAFYRADEASLEPLLVELSEAGVGTVNVTGFGPVELDGVAGYRLAADHPGLRHLVLER